MKKLLIILLFLANKGLISAQELPSFKAPEPSKVFEFTKYDQIPIGEYTGIPKISLPLYSIQVDNVAVPIGIQYHAGGFRVNEEASCVGLGWNMNFGQITQTINDKDDLSTVQYSRRLLKYQKAVNPVIYEWPMNCSNLAPSICQSLPNGTNCTPEPSFVTTIPSISNSIFIATNGYPIEGRSFCQTQDWDVNDPYIDSEPDIFRVDFLGHSLKFIKRFDTVNGTIEVLNNKGYKIEQITDSSNAIGWKIITPDGNQYIFGKMRQDNSSTRTDDISPDFLQASGNSYTNSWSLIKIITTKNKAIDFEYTDYGITKTGSYSQKLRKISQVNTWNFNSGQGRRYGNPSSTVYEGGDMTSYPLTSTIMYEQIVYVNKISTPNEVVTFEYSDRSDRLNDKKMDRVLIKNLKNTILKDLRFSYDYFIASETGNVFVTPNPTNPNYNPIYNSYRLKLIALQEIGSNPYVFEYDQNNLPRKTSTAVDFWGFYNGKTGNTSLAPNPATIGYPAFGDNGNDKSAYINFAKASVLKSIQYPTGGKIEYEHELNEYQRAPFETVIPNAGNVVGDFVRGNGIRIKSITLTDNGVLQRKTNYTYSAGISIVPFEILKHYTASTYVFVPGGGGPFTSDTFHGSTFSVDEFNNTSYQRPSLLGSFNIIGYGQVTMSHESPSGNGKTVYRFANKQDERSLQQHDYKIDIEMPSLMDINATENGKILSKEVYAAGSSSPLLRTEYTYTTKKSNIYYGNIIANFRNMFGFDCAGGGCVPFYKPQHLAGYYAIYGKQSLVLSEKNTEFFPAGSKWSITNYSYNTNNLVTNLQTSDQYGYAIYGKNTTYYTTTELTAKNWLSLPLTEFIVEKGQSNQQSYTYQSFGGITLPQSVEIRPGGGPAPEYKRKIIYDQYDEKGNLLEFHTENGLRTCVIWGYGKTLPIAKIDNADYNQISSLVSSLQSLSDTGTETALIAAVDNLRNTIPSAMITSYTHIPGRGLSTITDAKGNTAYYRYDDMGRLMSVKDEKDKLLAEYEYHFRPQN